jgi:hypothetical protein
MNYRPLFALAFALAMTFTTDAEAGPLRRRAQPVYQPSFQPSFQPIYQPALQPSPLPSTVVPGIEYVSNYTPATTSDQSTTTVTASTSGSDALDEVNALRASRGLRPFVRDEGLTQAAQSCAAFRAEHFLFGHTSNDFSFVPAGTYASSAGCAAYPPSFGWMSCCVNDGYTYGGAAWVMGRDGKRYMHLFVR